MNRIIKNGLSMLALGALAVSCADYNETYNFTAEPDPSYTQPYKDMASVKTYIDKSQYPNMSVGATVDLTTYNDQAKGNAAYHVAAATHFNDISFGSSFMPSRVIGKKGYMNFMALNNALNHTEAIGLGVYGSPIASNDNQADAWFTTLTSPVEIMVIPIEDKAVDYTTEETFNGTAKDNKTVIVKNFEGNNNALMIPKNSWAYVAEGFDVDPQGYYVITFYVKVTSAKSQSISCTFSGNQIMDGISVKRWDVEPGMWKKIVIETEPADGVTEGYFRINMSKNAPLYVQSVSVTHTPDNHRPQTEKEIKDTITYAIHEWCDGLMKNSAGRIKSFDLIDKALNKTAEVEAGILDLKHAADDASTANKIFWQDIFGSEDYAPTVYNAAKDAFVKYGGNAADLKFFVCETGLENQKRFNSLTYWIGKWEAKGAKIDGINAELKIVYSEDATTQAANEAAVNTLFDNLAGSGKLVRISNFDITYQGADGKNVNAKNITDAQRQQLADYYAWVIKRYMAKIPKDKQAGICKGNIVDTSDPVGLWANQAIDSKGTKDWVRTATYKAFCDALSGK